MAFKLLRSLTKRTMWSSAALSAAFLFVACSGGGGGTPRSSGGGGVQASGVQVDLAAGMTALTPDGADTLTGIVDVSRLGVVGFDRVYSLTTPEGEPFQFTIIASNPGNAGETTIDLGHGLVDGTVPVGGAETITLEGIFVDAPGIAYDGNWVEVKGDGFARVIVKGAIDDDQLLVVSVPNPDGSKQIIGIDIKIGPPSEINHDPTAPVGDVDVKSEKILYSSNSWQFGLPAIAVAGDRTTVVTYDGNESDPYSWERSRRWIQYDETNDTISGGTASSSAPDWGNWRDQEIAALGNVVAIVYTGNGEVRADVSLDRGGSFAVQRVLEPASESWGQRLVQAAISSDYKLGFLFWRSQGEWPMATSQLVLVEATPTSLDSNNTPVGYTWGAPKIIAAPGGDVVPLVMDIEYSSAGDIVIGYGYNAWIPNPADEMTRIATADFACAVKLVDGEWTTTTVDHEENIIPNDPSVDIVGSGATMQIFYAYEKTDGIHLMHSTNAGQSFATAMIAGTAGAFAPSIHVRDQAGATRVDMLYLDPAMQGLELHSLHYDDFLGGTGTPQILRLTQATLTEVPIDVQNDPYKDYDPGIYVGIGFMPPATSYTVVKDVPWFGYDAVTKGDDVAVVVHERTSEAYYFWGAMDMGRPAVEVAPTMGGGIFAGAAGGGNVAAPPPAVLLPGLTGTVRAPNTDDSSQLKLIVIN